MIHNSLWVQTSIYLLRIFGSLGWGIWGNKYLFILLYLYKLNSKFSHKIGLYLFIFLLYFHKDWAHVFGEHYPTSFSIKLTFSANSLMLVCLTIQPSVVSFQRLFFSQYASFSTFHSLHGTQSLADLTHDFLKHTIPSLPSTFHLSVTPILVAL